MKSSTKKTFTEIIAAADTSPVTKGAFEITLEREYFRINDGPIVHIKHAYGLLGVVEVLVNHLSLEGRLTDANNNPIHHVTPKLFPDN